MPGGGGPYLGYVDRVVRRFVPQPHRHNYFRWRARRLIAQMDASRR